MEREKFFPSTLSPALSLSLWYMNMNIITMKELLALLCIAAAMFTSSLCKVSK